MSDPSDHRSETEGEREKWAMVPRSVILGRIVPGGKSEAEAMALHLYAFLDLQQGARGRPARGFRRTAKALGWQERTVAGYARLLAKAGLITLDEGEDRSASSQAVMTVVHNPARQRFNAGCDLHAGDLSAPPKAGSRYRHGPQPAPTIVDPADPPLSRAVHAPLGRPLSRPVHQPEDRNLRPLLRPVHKVSDEPLLRPVHKVVRPVHQDDPTPVASDATGSRSKRYEEGLREGFRAREGNKQERRAPDVSTVARVEEVFGPVEVVEEGDVLCAACGAVANGQPCPDGTPMCKECEPF